VNTHRVQILDRTDHHTVVGVVSHDLELEFLPTLDRFFDQDLRNRAGFEAMTSYKLELFHGVGKAGAFATKDVCGANNYREADFLDGLASTCHARLDLFLFGIASAASRGRPRDFQANLDHGQLEPLAVLGRGNRFRVGADELNPMGIEYASFDRLHCQVERRLATKRWQQSIWLLDLDDLRQNLKGQRLDIGGVGELGVGHNCCRIRVSQDDPVTLFSQHPACLRTRVVKLTRLTNDDRARTNEQDR